jgi:hypothetical protein
MFSIYTTKAQKEYEGLDDLKIFADFLPYIGEVVISFSRVEKRLTWGIESLLQATRDEAHKMEAQFQNFTHRLEFFEIIGKHIARETDTADDFNQICLLLKKSNKFRNQLIHNSFTGIQTKGGAEISIMKEKWDNKPEKRSYKIELLELRNNAIENFEICLFIQKWILRVRPDAENRVP